MAYLASHEWLPTKEKLIMQKGCYLLGSYANGVPRFVSASE
jgi:hypothetical protein